MKHAETCKYFNTSPGTDGKGKPHGLFGIILSSQFSEENREILKGIYSRLGASECLKVFKQLLDKIDAPEQLKSADIDAQQIKNYYKTRFSREENSCDSSDFAQSMHEQGTTFTV